HGVLFLGFVTRTANQLAILVRLEVGQAHDDGLGVKRRPQGGDAFGKLFDEERTRTGVAARGRFDGALELGIDIGVVEHGLGMNGNVVVDDEFEPCKPDAVVGDLCEVEGELGIAHVHHDLEPDVGHFAPAHLFDLGLDEAVVNAAFVAFRARHRDFTAVFKHVSGVTATDNGRNAQFAGDDGRVAGTPATVGDDCGGQLHDRFPVRVGHVGDQDVAGLHLVHFRGIGHHANLARADFLTDGAPGDEHFAGGLEAITFLYVVGALLRLHGFGAGLQNVDLAVDAIAAPLDVHGAAVVLFDDDRVTGQFDDLVVGKRIAIALGNGNVDRAYGVAGAALGVEFHLDELGTDAAADDRVLACGQRRLEHVELVGVDGALHDRFAQAVRRGNENHVFEARLGVDGEHDAGTALVGAHHALHTRRQGHFGMRVAFVHAIRNGAVVVQRCEHVADFLEHFVDAHHVEIRFLLPRERRIGKVFGRGRRAHGKRTLPVGIELGKCLADFLLEFGRKRRVDDPLADLGTDRCQFAHVFGIERAELFGNALIKAGGFQEIAERLRGGGKPAGNAHTGAGQLADHLAERGILAADGVDVSHAQLLERNNVRHKVTCK